MGSQAPMFRADVIRRMVNEWLAQGCAVVIKPDGEISVTPPAKADTTDADFIKWGKK